uniref:(northern house mosquito) hypothetical protein n=1 Tax=Culex pipiens TaxID=7175 RepID=A0A8D8BRG5_CULPI
MRSTLESIIRPFTSGTGSRRYMLACVLYSPGLTVRMFSWDWSRSAGPISALWNRRSPSCFKKVILTEHPSAAPTPLSRRICCAWTKFSADSRARVIKCRGVLPP